MANPLAAVALDYMIAQMSMILTYGIYLPVFIASFRILLRRARKHPVPPKFLIIVSSMVFCSTATYFITIMVQSLKCFSRLRGVDSEHTLDSFLSFMQSSWPLDVVSSVMRSFNFTAGNTVLVWRACVLWQRHLPVQVILWCLLFGQAAISSGEVVNQAILLKRSDGRDVSGHMKVYKPAMFISLGVNLIATLFVVTQTWNYRRSFRKSTMRKSNVFEILSLLIECGFCLCSIQLVHAVLTILRAQSHRPPQWTSLPLEALVVAAPIAPFLVILAAMCPCFIILLTARHDNVIKAYNRSNSTMLSTANRMSGFRASTLTEIHFASKVPAQVILGSAETSVTTSTSSDSAQRSRSDWDVEKLNSS